MRAAIMSGALPPGQRLVERTLCDQLGVSRTVIRETIRYLEAEGLVEILSGRGPIVATMSREDARQIYEIRRMLEVSAAERCAANMTEERKASLKRALSDLKKVSATDDPDGWLAATTAFYAAIFEGANHKIAWDVVQRLNSRIGRLRIMTLASKKRKAPGIKHMEAICKAIVSGDRAAAGAAVTRHLEDTAEIADRLLKDEEDIDDAAT